VVARVMWPTTSRVLAEAGLAPGMRCLDLGCGGGDVTLQLATSVGPLGQVIGIDMDETKLDLGQQTAKRLGLGNVQFRRLNVHDWIEESQYDCIYSRFLLTHLADPLRVLRQMLRAVRPGGLVVIEDIDFGGHFCHPPCAGFDAYVRLYRTAAARQGADADIGPKLYGMLLDAGARGEGQRRPADVRFGRGQADRRADAHQHRRLVAGREIGHRAGVAVCH
jgi:2-polyprenyl-3-methyl-5-hydroxy-6-metoxy-1,4-benzoquinol methylase